MIADKTRQRPLGALHRVLFLLITKPPSHREGGFSPWAVICPRRLGVDDYVPRGLTFPKLRAGPAGGSCPADSVGQYLLDFRLLVNREGLMSRAEVEDLSVSR